VKDRLILDQGHDHLWRIYWEVVCEGSYDIGATLGEGPGTDWKGPAPKSNEDGEWDHWMAQRAASVSDGVEQDHNGFFWESKRAARSALRVINEALKHQKPMPEWAQKALAAGWKPPKGWRA
jgi:hypothetical protein